MSIHHNLWRVKKNKLGILWWEPFKEVLCSVEGTEG